MGPTDWRVWALDPLGHHGDLAMVIRAWHGEEAITQYTAIMGKYLPDEFDLYVIPNLGGRQIHTKYRKVTRFVEIRG